MAVHWRPKSLTSSAITLSFGEHFELRASLMPVADGGAAASGDAHTIHHVDLVATAAHNHAAGSSETTPAAPRSPAFMPGSDLPRAVQTPGSAAAPAPAELVRATLFADAHRGLRPLLDACTTSDACRWQARRHDRRGGVPRLLDCY